MDLKPERKKKVIENYKAHFEIKQTPIHILQSVEDGLMLAQR